MSKTKTLTIKVKQKHIEKGVRYAPDTCPIALALKEHFELKKKDTVCVSPREINVKKNNGFSFSFRWTKTMPKEVGRFISKFDGKKSVKPFSFKLPFVS